MLRIHFMRQWFTLSDPAMEEALNDAPLFREFAGLDNWNMRLPDESTILRFRHLLEISASSDLPRTLNVLLRYKPIDRHCRPCGRRRKYAPAAVIVPEEKDRSRAGSIRGLDAHVASFIQAGATKLNYAQPHRRSRRKPLFYQEPQGPLGDDHVRLLSLLPTAHSDRLSVAERCDLSTVRVH
jgi:hypothetical protein